MVLTVVLLASTPIGQDLLKNQGTLVLGAFLIPIYTPFRINLLGGFLALFGIYVICFVAAVRSNGGFLTGLRGLFTGSTQQRVPNWLVVMPVASSALLLVVLAVTLVQSAVGVSTGSLPPLEPYKLLYTLAYAPPLEETMFRISTLGLLVALRVVWSSAPTPFGGNVGTMPSFVSETRCKNCGAPLNPKQGEPVATCRYCGYAEVVGEAPASQPRLSPILRQRSTPRLIVLSFLFPEKAKSEAGLPTLNSNGWRAFHWTEWLVLILTSVGFGVAHLLSNVGWEAGKVVTAALSGFALGLAYLSYGAYASILLHWFFNVYFEVYSLGSTFIGGAFVTVEVLVGLLVLASGAIGIVAGIARLASGEQGGGETTYMTPSTFPPA